MPVESVEIKLKATEGSEPQFITVDGSDLTNGLQYGATAGLPRLVKVRQHEQLRGNAES